MISLCTLEWLCRKTGVRRGSRGFLVLEMVLVNENSYRDVVDTLGLKDFTARKVVSRFKQRVSVRREETDQQIAAMPTLAEIKAALEGKLTDEERQTLKEQQAVRRDALRITFSAEQLEKPIPEGGETVELSSRDQAKVILCAISGHPPSNPPTPTYDHLGRKVGGGSRMVSVDELARFIERADGERRVPVKFVRTSLLPGWKIGPFCG